MTYVRSDDVMHINEMLNIYVSLVYRDINCLFFFRGDLLCCCFIEGIR